MSPKPDPAKLIETTFVKIKDELISTITLQITEKMNGHILE